MTDLIARGICLALAAAFIWAGCMLVYVVA